MAPLTPHRFGCSLFNFFPKTVGELEGLSHKSFHISTPSIFSLLFSQPSKKLTQEVPTFLLQHSPRHLRVMVELFF